MINVNGKIFANNKTNNKYMVLNKVIDCTNTRDGEQSIVYASVDCVEDNNWYVREEQEFFAKFTEIA